jgi:CubicO group peptidase (beta-lactamase class C family)
VEELLARIADEHGVPGLAVAVIVDAAVARVAVHGCRDQERRLPVTVDTPFRWYSISKQLTALALAQLVERNRLDWDQTVASLVPSARFADPVATERATVTDCLLHRTGLCAGNWTWLGAPADPLELLRRLPHFSCRAGFRSGHRYQNLHFTILGEVFKAAGTDWHRAMRELLAPVGVNPLTRTAEFIRSDRALGYGPTGFASPVRVDDVALEGIEPASAVCGSIRDLARVAAAVAGGAGAFVTAQMWEHLTRPMTPVMGPPWPELQESHVSLAGRVLKYRGEPAIHWAGGFRGYGSQLVALPRLGVAVCALANRTGSVAPDALAWALVDRAAGWERLPWADRWLEQKRALRQSGQQRLEARLARATLPWTARDWTGTFAHAGYGGLTVTADGHLEFRGLRLTMAQRTKKLAGADGLDADGGEVMWDLKPVVAGDRVEAWMFNPDDPNAPCRFDRVK